MVLVVSFCSVFSIRLGSIIVAALSLMQAAAMEIACIVGLYDIQSVSQNLNDFMYEKDFIFMTGFVNSVKKHPEPYIVGTLVILIVYSFTCILLIYGALKLNACLVMPFVVAEFLRLCATLGLLVAGMLVLKKNSLDLGPLMGGSCGGGLLMVLLLYMWACPVSLLQELVRRIRERRSKAKLLQPANGYANGYGNGYANGYGHDVMGPPVTRGPSALNGDLLEAKKLWRHTTHLTQPQPYPYITQYPAYRGYPMYIE